MSRLKAALIVVDVQGDFCPGGALAVKDGDRVIPGLNKTIRAFDKFGLPIFFTRDWHPTNHMSFKGQGGIWPPHCVQGTKGASFQRGLVVPPSVIVVSKGYDVSKEAYSGFQGTDLKQRLRKSQVDELVIGGLATDYCVKETALEARRAGFMVDVLEDCIRAVDVHQKDGERALEEMLKKGVNLTTSSAVIKRMASTQQ